jgi:ubiquinone/menaquinone biosynthesis C-methylase UbiE
MVKQDDVFFDSEGNNWFNRNKSTLSQKGSKNDEILSLLKMYNIKPKRVLEVGTSNGYRLFHMHEEYQCEVFGVEPSEEAIHFGQNVYPCINFQRSTVESMKYNDHFFDMVLINFVFHWIDRDSLLRSCANIDNVLKWGGHLVIGDFQIPSFIKRKYHHITNQDLFTFKMPYKNIFSSTGNYKEIATVSYNHDLHTYSDTTTLQNYASVSLLKKEELSILDE